MAELSLRDVPGLRVGHWTDADAVTGCTVVLATDGATAGVEVRGAAPGTRETDLLSPTALVERIHGVLLTGGSAFGLAAADGVMRWLAERGIGVETGVRRVPIVPAAVIFDLGIGSATAFPDADAGYAACDAAERGDRPLEGSLGAGTGATLGKLAGLEHATKAGIGSHALRLGDGPTVGALVVTNALGNVLDAAGRVLAGVRSPDGGFRDADEIVLHGPTPAEVGRFGAANSVLVVIGTDASLDRAACRKLAELAQDALARCVAPVHTMYDGDTAFVLATGRGAPAAVSELLPLGVAVDQAVRRAVQRSVELAESRGGVPALRDLAR